MLRTMLLAAVAVCLVATGSIRGELWDVPGDVPTIQGAIELVDHDDDIRVAPGTYPEVIDFLGKSIHLYSSGGREVTVIDGTGLNASIVSCTSGEASGSILEGFTITGGNGGWYPDEARGGGMRIEGSGPTVISCLFTGNEVGETDFTAQGGAVYNHLANPVFRDCVFEDNMIWGYGGGMYSDNSFVRLERCRFVGNESRGYSVSGGFVGCGGGGMHNAGALVSIDECEFTGNSADAYNHSAHGGGIESDTSSILVIRDSTFTGNSAEGAGGAIRGGQLRLTSCAFTGNAARSLDLQDDLPSVASGGAVSGTDLEIIGCSFVGNGAGCYCDGAGGAVAGSGVIVNSVFQDNRAHGCCVEELFGLTGFAAGGAIGDFGGGFDIDNCMFVGNVAEAGDEAHGGAVSGSASTVIRNSTFVANRLEEHEPGYGAGEHEGSAISGAVAIVNSIVWDVGSTDAEPISVGAAVRYSDVEGGFTGVGNIIGAPQFVDAAGGDFRLAPGSPCIDAGENTSAPRDTLDLDDDGNTTERIAFDLGGGPRFVDDPDTLDTGAGFPPIVDMGADEYEPQTTPCPGDVNGDGEVGYDDVLSVLASWGPCASGARGFGQPYCFGDIDGDDEVGYGDLLIVLSAWGPCPQT